MDVPATILAVDDDRRILRLLEITLQAGGYRTTTCMTCADATLQAATMRPDLMVLDLGLPDGEGITVLQTLREWSALPVIILSARNNEEDIVRCLDAGANDYLVKPFRTSELLARVRSALRHAARSETGSTFTFGDVRVDLAARRVEKAGEIVHLTALEYGVLACLVKDAGKILTHGQILQAVWGPSFIEETQYLRVHIAQIRKKLEDDPSAPRLIITETGIGYRLTDVQEE